MRFFHLAKVRLTFLAVLSLPLVAGAESSDTATLAAPEAISASATTSTQPGNPDNRGIVFDRTITQDYLKPTSKEVGNPRLTIGRYSVAEGLVAGYQSETGKRILFAVRPMPGGKMTPVILHHDPSTQQFTSLFDKSKRLDDSGQQVKDIEVAGIDILDMLRTLSAKVKGRDVDNAKIIENHRKMKQFLQDESGHAILEGLPALYAALEEIDKVTPEEGRSKFLVPFGAFAMAVQLGANHYQGFKHADHILGAARAKEMRDNCAGFSDCEMRGKYFIIHPSGLFNVVSKHKRSDSMRVAPKLY